MSRTWILQGNPRFYDIGAALAERSVIYWRVPQYTSQLKNGDRVLLWRSGTSAGFVGWGVLLAEPEHFDLSRDDDPFVDKSFHQPLDAYYVPVRVWPAQDVSKAEVSNVLPDHRIVTAPMGTVFPLEPGDIASLAPLLAARGYQLDRSPEDGHALLPVLPTIESELKPEIAIEQASAKITPALFLLSSTPSRPVEITIEGDALRLLLTERDALKALDEQWDSVGIYLLIGRSSTEEAELSVYVGKAQGLRTRIKGHADKAWTRLLLVQREGLHPFNASDISWLERRLIDILLETPSVDLVNRTAPPHEAVPDYKAEILERTVVATLGVLAVLGAFVS